MASKIEIFRGRDLLGVFWTHLEPGEAVENIEADGIGAFADWSGTFVPTDADQWERGNYGLDWELDGEPFYRAGDIVGEVTPVTSKEYEAIESN